MKRTAIVYAVSALAIVLAAPQGVVGWQASAQGIQQPSTTAPTAFDANAFFEQLRLNGVSASEGFDAERFFEKLRLEGVSDQQPLDADAFFEKLRLEGVSVPEGFDAKRFFDELALRGVAGPPMIAPAGGIPTASECQAGWRPAGKWDQTLFERLCQGRR
jgi:hypothetical protein